MSDSHNCWGCSHFEYDPGSPGGAYPEDPRFVCKRGHYSDLGPWPGASEVWNPTREVAYELFQRALVCHDYHFFKDPLPMETDK